MFNIRYSLYIKALAIMLSFAFIFESSGYALRVPVMERQRIRRILPDAGRIEPYDDIQKSLEGMRSDWDKLLKRRLSILFDPPYFDIEPETGNWIYRENIWNAVIDGEIVLEKALSDLRNTDDRDELIKDFAICDAIIWFLTVYLQEFHPDGVEGHNFFQERLSRFRLELKNLFEAINANDPEQLIIARQPYHRHYGRRKSRESWEDITAEWREEFDKNGDRLPGVLKDDDSRRKIEFVDAEIMIPDTLNSSAEDNRAVKVRGFMVINAVRDLVIKNPRLEDILFADKGRKLNCRVFNGEDELRETSFLPKHGILRITPLESNNLPAVVTSKVSLARPGEMLAGVVDLSLDAPSGLWISLQEVVSVFAYIDPAGAQIQFERVLGSLPEAENHDIDSEASGYFNKVNILLSLAPYISLASFKRQVLPSLISHCMRIDNHWNRDLYEIIQDFGKDAPDIIEAEFQKYWHEVTERYPNVEGKILRTLGNMAACVSASVADPAFIFLASRIDPVHSEDSLELVAALSARVSPDIAKSYLPRFRDKLGYNPRLLSKLIASLSAIAGQDMADVEFESFADALEPGKIGRVQDRGTIEEVLYNLESHVSDSAATSNLAKIIDSYIVHEGRFTSLNVISSISKRSQSYADLEFSRVIDVLINEKNKERKVREAEVLRKLAPHISPAVAAQKLPLLINIMLGEDEDGKFYSDIKSDLLDTIIPMIKKVSAEYVTEPILISMIGILSKMGTIGSSQNTFEFVQLIGSTAQKSPLIAKALFDAEFDSVRSAPDYKTRCLKVQALASLAPAITVQAAQERLEKVVNYYRTMTFHDQWFVKMQLSVVIKVFNAALFFENLRKLEGAITEDNRGKTVVKIDYQQDDMHFILQARIVDLDTNRTIAWVHLNPILDIEGKVYDPSLDTGNLSYFYINFDISPKDIRPAAKGFLISARNIIGETLVVLGNPTVQISKPGWVNFLDDVVRGIPIHDARQLEGILHRPSEPVNPVLLAEELDLRVQRFIGPECEVSTGPVKDVRSGLLRVPMIGGKDKTGENVGITAEEFDKSLMQILKIDPNDTIMTHRQVVEVNGHSYVCNFMSWHRLLREPLYFRVGDIFVLNPDARLVSKDEDRFEKLLKSYKQWFYLEEIIGNWNNYAFDTGIGGSQAIFLTAGILAALQEIKSELARYALIDIGSWNSLYCNAGIILGAFNAVAIENKIARNSIAGDPIISVNAEMKKKHRIKHTDNLMVINALINGNQDKIRVIESPFSAIDSLEDESVVIFNLPEFGEDYYNIPVQHRIGKLMRRLTKEEQLAFYRDQEIEESRRKSLLSDIVEKIPNAKYIIASGGQIGDEKKLLRRAKSLNLEMIFKISVPFDFETNKNPEDFMLVTEHSSLTIFVFSPKAHNISSELGIGVLALPSPERNDL